MKTFKNAAKVNEIKFEKEVKAYCPLGKADYTCKIKVSVMPNRLLFDFCDAEKAIDALNGQPLIVEELAQAVYEIMAEIKPLYIKVQCEAVSPVHFPVTVIKQTI